MVICMREDDTMYIIINSQPSVSDNIPGNTE